MNTRINKIIAVALILALGPVVANAAGTEWTVASGGNGNFYEVITANGISWVDAKTAALLKTHDGTPTGVPGHLATITSAAEDLFVDGKRATAGLGQAWIGGSQLDNQSAPGVGWSWENGEGSIPGVDSAAPYADWGDNAAASDIEPNDAGGASFPVEENLENHLALGRYGVGGGWNDESPANIAGYIVEYDFASRFVPVGGGVISTGASTGVAAKYTNVLVGGDVSIHCCEVRDDREYVVEMPGKGKWLNWRPAEFDLGDAIMTTAGCEDLRPMVRGTAVMQPWQRGVPKYTVTDTEEVSHVHFDHDNDHKLGVCKIQSAVVSRGVIFTEEDTTTVLGYAMDCSEDEIAYRPFTGAVALDPTEIDAPYVVRISADCDGSRSAKKGSTNLLVLNLWHEGRLKKAKNYVESLIAKTISSIDNVRREGCVDNSEFFLNNLASLTRMAKELSKSSNLANIDAAIEALDDATRLALLISPVGPTPLPSVDDPYAPGGMECPGNAEGLLVGRLMAAKFAVCSERKHPGPGDHSSSSVMDNEHCEIAADILAKMP